MARYRGVYPKGSGIEIVYQVRGIRRSRYVNKKPTDAALADAARLRKSLIESERLGESEAGNITFEDACLNFLAEKATKLKQSTLDSYRSKLEYYWSDLAKYPVRAIRYRQIAEIDGAITWRSQKTRREVHAVIRGVFRWAIAHEFADSNPAERLRAGGWQRPEIDAFSDEERSAILSELSGHHLVFYTVMFETGCRTGELMALRWADVRGDRLRIERSVYRGEDGGTKTHQAREVLLTVAAQQALASHTETRFRGEHVFLTQYSTPYANDRGLTFAFRAACKRAGVRYRRPYYARHTFACRALSAGCEPSWVAEQMGDRLETVLRHYGKWIRQDRGRAELLKLEGNAESASNGGEKKA